MTDDNASQEARKGLLDGIKGKAKEVVGAVTGNDSLTTEGQLQAAQAREKKEAKASELAAETQAAQAGEDLSSVKNAADDQRAAAEESARASEDEARRAQQAQRIAAEQEKDRAVAAEIVDAEVDARAEQIEAVAEGQADAAAASQDQLDAVVEYSNDVSEAEAARAAAERARRNA
ncbi:general stress protein CsbD [Rhodococcus sovatensis]|uniref:General stress protein CsbD n=1 Tax=Rhodococcus sovatensis TaxID=1805840 RepID=A0ABZ2PHN3_9NOCA